MRKHHKQAKYRTPLYLQQFPDSKVSHSGDWKILKLQGEPPSLDAEFAGTDQVLSLFAGHGLNLGRCFGSKSAFRVANPQCDFVPNANVCSARAGKLWWGDLDLKSDGRILEKIAYRLKQKIYVLREGDARWNEAGVIGNEVAAHAIWCTGGPMRIYGLAAFLKHSGLTLTMAARLVGSSSVFLGKRHPPAEALEYGQHLDAVANYFSMFVETEPGTKWGHWLLRSNPALGGEKPYSLVITGRKRELTQLLRNSAT